MYALRVMVVIRLANASSVPKVYTDNWSTPLGGGGVNTFSNIPPVVAPIVMSNLVLAR